MLSSRATCVLVLSLLLAGCAAAPSRGPKDSWSGGAWNGGAWSPATASSLDGDEGSSSHGLGHRLLLYIPNRIFDVLDIVRARVRVGPGFAIGVRATQLAAAEAGFYSAFFVGVPGPRLQPEINWPFGVEAVAKAGATIVGADVSAGTDGVAYGYGEIGLGFQAAIVGLDVGVDVWEVVDLVVGLLTFNVVDDDL
jgi:hypothetical protein